jgi:GT2 family glycosyltransferase/pyruvate-formate lyase-activating enzyme
MLEGALDEICAPNCPILQGHYKELTPPRESLDSAAPHFVRVVPTTSCNLNCPMCYQQDDPPTRLPADLFQQLQPWLRNGYEFLILGGEPFLARRCLEWIERLTPAEYPTLSLCAITNGHGFTRSGVELVMSRAWHWILVSIDAASPEVYTKVRTGDFEVLKARLARLAEARNASGASFELRFGFALQKSNLSDALPFLDFAESFGAVPEYTMVFGTWHDEYPRDASEVRQFRATLERLDKELWARGFSHSVVAGALARLDSDFAYEPVAAASVPAPAPASGPRTPRVCAAPAALPHSARSPAFLTRAVGSVIELEIPFRSGENVLSVLDAQKSVDRILRIATARGCRVIPAMPEEPTFASPDDLDPPVIERWSRPAATATAPVASVIAAAYDCDAYVDRFLSSLDAQTCSQPFEIVLVDDGSTDGTFERACAASSTLRSDLSVTVLRLARSIPYSAGSWNFRAGVARQVAADHSSAGVLVFFDPDQEIDRDALAEHLWWQARNFSVVIGERTYADAAAGQAATRNWHTLRRTALTADAAWWLAFFTGNSSVTRSLFDRAGGFDRRLQYWGLDDTDLAYRIARQHPRFWQTPRASVTHLGPSSGGGETEIARLHASRIHMEVLYRKYLDPTILEAFEYACRAPLRYDSWPPHD